MRRLLVGALVVVVWSLAACGSSSGVTGVSGGGGGGGGGGGNAVTVGNNFFSPDSVSVPSGTKVTWTWAGGVSHNVTFDDGAPGSSTQSSGTFSRTFTTSGTYTYYCTIHGRAVMHGTVVVP